MESLLVANRAEIAVRILSAAAGLGVRGVAVHPADDTACLHVARADAAVELPGEGAAAYLDADAIVAAAREAGADAIHPGYGFLSESAAFARAVVDAGLTWVGPSPDLLALFGDKARARAHAIACDVPVLPATQAGTTLEQAHAFLAEHGAIMVKAVSGGGGRGMAPVTEPGELEDAWERCAAEARAATGEGALYAEALLTGARHVEVQLLGDGSDVVHLHTRDCTLQLRRQKVVEIAPAAAVDPAPLTDAALRLAEGLRGLATVEFLVGDDGRAAFIEVNPRLQVEHTVTEELLGVDLVEAQLQIADGATLSDVGLREVPEPHGTSIELRVTATPGRIERFAPPLGRGVRVDTHAYAGYEVSARYDPLLLKLVVRDPGDLAAAQRRALRALDELVLDGVATNGSQLREILEADLSEITTTWVEEHVSAPAPVASRDAGADAVLAPVAGVVVSAGPEGVVLESMKMHHEVPGPLHDVAVAPGDQVIAGMLLGRGGSEGDAADDVDPDHVREDLREVLDRRANLLDDARPDAVAKRRKTGHRTARENLDDLCDPGSFVEYGGLTIAAQRARRSEEDLIARTQADGMVCGTAEVGGVACVVMAYDYTVMAGTQGTLNHLKKDRMLELALRHELPVVLYAEGGGGRPGDTDQLTMAALDVPTFELFAKLSGSVPVVSVVTGRCFAGNAALAGCSDLIIATKDASLGMGGPAMIEGGGLGVFAPDDVGPMSVQEPNGVVDLVVEDEAEATDAVKRYLGFVTQPVIEPGEAPDARQLRHVVPPERRRVYDVRPAMEHLFDVGSVLELRPRYGVGILTAFARIEGRAVGVLANDPRHLGGAIDAEAADKAARFLQLCDAHALPVVSLCDTPGFMVGPDAEETATVRRFSRMFVAGANLRVPVVLVVLRKAYGLGAMAMAGGSMRVPFATVGWPTSEFGGMGLEGAVRLGFRAELEAIEDPDARAAREAELIASLYERGKGLSIATVFEIDDVIDPADTRAIVARSLAAAGRPTETPRRAFVDAF